MTRIPMPPVRIAAALAGLLLTASCGKKPEDPKSPAAPREPVKTDSPAPSPSPAAAASTPSSPAGKESDKKTPSIPPPSSASSLNDHGLNKALEIALTPKVKLTLQSIPAGTFTIGSPETEDGRSDDEKPARITLTKDFWLARAEFTQAQWLTVMEENPSNFKGDDLPVDSVSWEDAQKCLTALNQKSPLPAGWMWALPSEAQWEYACRAGTTTTFSTGDTLTSTAANFNGEYPYGTDAKGPYLEKTAAPGRYPANAWGLVDMHGNVSEWCQDAWDGGPYTPATDPLISGGPYRVARGGSWLDAAKSCRSAFHVRYTADHRNYDTGFRVAALPVEKR